MSYAASLWVAVWLAVAVQVGAGAVAQAEADPALAAATIFCHGGQDHGQHHAPLHRHLVDQGILRSSVGALQALAVLESAPCLPAPSFARTGRAEPMQARAPPARSLRAFDARGPPIPV